MPIQFFCCLQFVDDDSGEQLVEFLTPDRIRPALPAAAAHFQNWDELQVTFRALLYPACIEYVNMSKQFGSKGILREVVK